MEHREQIEAIVRDVLRAGNEEAWRGRAGFLQLWSSVRRRLRALRDTATSLWEDEQTALALLYRAQAPPSAAAGEAPAD